MVSAGVDVQLYKHIKLPLSREAHLQVMAVGLEAANAILPSPLCIELMLPLAATLAIFKAMLYSPSVILKDKGQAAKAGDYLTKWLATVAMLVDMSTPAVVTLYDNIPLGKKGRLRGSGEILLFDIICRLAHRVPLTKLFGLDVDICQYLAALIMATLAQAGKTLVMPEGIQIRTIIREAFNNMLLKGASHNYDNYGLVSR